MVFLLAEAASSSVGYAGGIDGWGKAAQEYGLGVVLAGFVACVLFFLIRNMIKGHKENMTNMVGLVQSRDTTLDNHLNHVTAALDGLTQVVSVSVESQKNSVEKLVTLQQTDHAENRNLIDKLVSEQRHSTEMVREIVESKIDKLTDRNK